MQIDKAVVWITGASSGIGEALAYEIHRKGGIVVLSARNREKLAKMAEKIGGERSMIVPLDMTDRTSFPFALEQVLEKWGRVDILINNAGVSQRAPVSETKISVIEKIMETNFMGPAALTSLIIPHMIERKRGYCLFVSSVAGKFATPLRSSYSASKMALQGFTDALRAEVYEDNIKVSLIVPGFVKTEISVNALEGEGQKHNLMDPNQARGITPSKAAGIIIRGIEREKREIYMGLVGKTRFALFMSRFFPGILARIIRKADVK